MYNSPLQKVNYRFFKPLYKLKWQSSNLFPINDELW